MALVFCSSDKPSVSALSFSFASKFSNASLSAFLSSLSFFLLDKYRLMEEAKELTVSKMTCLEEQQSQIEYLGLC